VFINGPSKKVIGGIVADIRRRAAAAGRDPRDLVIYTMMTVITDQTREAALEKFRDYQRYVSTDGALALMSGWTGVDFSALPKNEPLRFQSANAMTSALEAFTTADPDRDWTVDEIARHAGIGGRGPVIVGSYQDVADEFEDWVRETDVDGFNLAYAVTPETFVDIVDLVVPELRRRGLYKTEYAPGTLREKLYGPGRARLPDSHPAARVRGMRHERR
jgi:alkanesulfonate monooxygenase